VLPFAEMAMAVPDAISKDFWNGSVGELIVESAPEAVLMTRVEILPVPEILASYFTEPSDGALICATAKSQL